MTATDNNTRLVLDIYDLCSSKQMVEKPTQVSIGTRK